MNLIRQEQLMIATPAWDWNPAWQPQQPDHEWLQMWKIGSLLNKVKLYQENGFLGIGAKYIKVKATGSLGEDSNEFGTKVGLALKFTLLSEYLRSAHPHQETIKDKIKVAFTASSKPPPKLSTGFGGFHPAVFASQCELSPDEPSYTHAVLLDTFNLAAVPVLKLFVTVANIKPEHQDLQHSVEDYPGTEGRIPENSILSRIELPLPLNIVQFATFKKNLSKHEFLELWYRLGMTGEAMLKVGPNLEVDPKIATSAVEIRYYFPEAVLIFEDSFLSIVGLVLVHPSTQIVKGLLKIHIEKEMAPTIHEQLRPDQIRQIDPPKFKIEYLCKDPQDPNMQQFCTNLYKLLLIPHF